MKMEYNIFVEGLADARFFKQYINHLFGETVADERLVILKGWDNLKTEASALRMRSMSANGGVNLVIVDADNNFQARKDEIERWRKENEVQFELFLLPNNQDTGIGGPIGKHHQSEQPSHIRLLGTLRAGTGATRHPRPYPAASHHPCQEDKDIRLPRSLVGRDEKPKRVNQRGKPQLRKSTALEFECRVFGTC